MLQLLNFFPLTLLKSYWGYQKNSVYVGSILLIYTLLETKTEKIFEHKNMQAHILVAVNIMISPAM